MNPPVAYPVEYAGWGDLAVGDINNDGLLDVIVLSGGGVYATLGVLIQNPDGTFGAVTYYGSIDDRMAEGMAVGDVNGDGRNDIVINYQPRSGDGYHVGVMLQNSQGTLDPPTVYGVLDTATSVEIADVNNDGRKDVLMVTASGGDVAV